MRDLDALNESGRLFSVTTGIRRSISPVYLSLMVANPAGSRHRLVPISVCASATIKGALTWIVDPAAHLPEKEVVAQSLFIGGPPRPIHARCTTGRSFWKIRRKTKRITGGIVLEDVIVPHGVTQLPWSLLLKPGHTIALELLLWFAGSLSLRFTEEPE